MANVKQNIQSIENIPGIRALSDYDAENVSAGAFRVTVGNIGVEPRGDGFVSLVANEAARSFSGDTGTVDLGFLPRELKVESTDDFGGDPFADIELSNSFLVTFLTNDGSFAGERFVSGGDTIMDFAPFQRNGAVRAEITQYYER